MDGQINVLQSVDGQLKTLETKKQNCPVLCLKMINETALVAGLQDGSLFAWDLA